MIKVLLIMIAGIVAGYLLRRKEKTIKWLNKSALYIIFLLLFFMGIAVGNNPTIMENLGTIGLKGLILSVFALLGSVMLAWLVYVVWFKNK